ncbi:MAG: VanZ family protein [Pseudomonadales bacterium]
MADRALRTCLLLGFWLPLAICTYMAFAPHPPDAVFRISDVVLHGFAFTYLTFALCLAHPAPRWWLPGLWMLGYGASIEVVQMFEVERSAELKDLMVDLLGILTGLAAARALGPWTRATARAVLVRLLPG